MRLFILIVCMAFGQSVYGTEQMRTQIYEALKPVITTTENNQMLRHSYCPDNLCLMVEYPNKLSKETVADFLLLFYFESEWPEFTDVSATLPTGVNISKRLVIEVPKLLRKYDSLFIQKTAKDYKSLIEIMKIKYGIKTYFGREDERYYSEEELK